MTVKLVVASCQPTFKYDLISSCRNFILFSLQVTQQSSTVESESAKTMNMVRGWKNSDTVEPVLMQPV